MHKHLKSWYSRTNKNNAPKQITSIERRTATLDKIFHQCTAGRQSETSLALADTVPHHHISVYAEKWSYIPIWLEERARDEAFKVCQQWYIFISSDFLAFRAFYQD